MDRRMICHRPTCGQWFNQARFWQKYCSAYCQRNHHNERRREAYSPRERAKQYRFRKRGSLPRARRAVSESILSGLGT